MQNNKLTSQILYAAIASLRAEYTKNSALSSVGLIPDDLVRLTQDDAWTSQDRIRVQRIMTSLRDGLAEAQGFQPFRVPAEYQAALIAGFVHPLNWRAACAWLASVSVPASDIAAGAAVGSSEPVQADQLYSLLYYADIQEPGFLRKLESKVFKQQQKAEEKGVQE